MIRRTRILRDESGASAIEMALSLPVLVTMIYGIFTLGQLFEGNSGIQHALGEGARYGNLCLGISNGVCTLPTSTALGNQVNSKLFGTSNGTFSTPSVDTSTASTGYVTVSVRYDQAMNFLFFTTPTITLRRSKRVYLADTPPTQSTCTTMAADHASDPTNPAKPAAPASCSIYS
jgi:Flp pilus assembly protein TadG